MSSSKPLLLLLLLVLSSSAANAAVFTISNNCPYTVWPASLPSGGFPLNSGESGSFNFAAGTSSGRIWGRTGCSFNGAGQGSCQTGDCNGQLVCQVSGSPATLAEFTLNGGGNNDYYDISVIDAYNLPMQFSPTDGNCRSLSCTDPNCPDAYHQPDDLKTFSCPSGTDYSVVFCP